METGNWTAVVINLLPFAPWEEICIALFRRFDQEEGVYNERDLNALPTNIIGWKEAATRISKHSAHPVALDRSVQTKTFHWQIAGLRKLHNDKGFEALRQFLLGRDIFPKYFTNIYKRCSSSATSLLDTAGLNTA